MRMYEAYTSQWIGLEERRPGLRTFPPILQMSETEGQHEGYEGYESKSENNIKNHTPAQQMESAMIIIRTCYALKTQYTTNFLYSYLLHTH